MNVERSSGAGILLIGDELLSGRTRDVNLQHIATVLGTLGIAVREARVVPDLVHEIVAAVRALAARHSFVFTTGGIGPTHDDVTAEAMARAFDRPLTFHPQAVAALERYYGPEKFNDARRRMARVPEGAALIENPVSVAPGFRIDNVFVLAGIPLIVEAMMESLKCELPGGPAIESRIVVAAAGEGDLAQGLAALQDRHSGLAIGSYPGLFGGRMVTRIVARGTDTDELEEARDEAEALVRHLGYEVLE
ncbi:MAG: competence/damage-inducible protein A [Alphaproteobacteria bacterium]|nr:competence/damage-inducible protein A [Alphaproteobacteria bacterium]